jgi:hypothetical protein
MILLYPLPLVSLLLCTVAGSNVIPSECLDFRKSDREACAQPIEDVVAVTPGSSYAAKLRCYDCPFDKGNEQGVTGEHGEASADNDLVGLLGADTCYQGAQGLPLLRCYSFSKSLSPTTNGASY